MRAAFDFLNELFQDKPQEKRLAKVVGAGGMVAGPREKDSKRLVRTCEPQLI